MNLINKAIGILKNKEIMSYLFFGVATTVINFVVFTLSDIILGDNLYLVSNLIAWVLSVIFAYVTNKIWVFESKQWNIKIVSKEVIGFVSGRIFSLLVEQVGMYVFVDVAGLGEKTFNVFGIIDVNGKMITKVFFLVVVIILNYVFSKLWVFRKSKKEHSDKE